MIIEIVEEGYLGLDEFGPLNCCGFVAGPTGW